MKQSIPLIREEFPDALYEFIRILFSSISTAVFANLPEYAAEYLFQVWPE